MNKKIILNIGTSLFISIPIISMVSCNKENETIKGYESNSKIWKKINNNYFNKWVKEKDIDLMIRSFNLKDTIELNAKLKKINGQDLPAIIINKEILRLYLLKKMNNNASNGKALNELINWLNTYKEEEINYLRISNLFMNEKISTEKKIKREKSIEAFHDISPVFKFNKKLVSFGTFYTYYAKINIKESEKFITDDITNKIDLSIIKEIWNDFRIKIKPKGNRF